MRLEKDRLAARVDALEAQVKSYEESQRSNDEQKTETKKKKKKGVDSVLPTDEAYNPYLSTAVEPPNVDALQLSRTFKAHDNAITALAAFPKKPVIATVSDDTTWKLWSIPDGELIMSGDGHREWVASCDFHPAGTHLATCSGDGLVKLWDFKNASCAATFSDHTQVTWDVAFHHTGDFLISASMDQTAKLWDLNR